jgi:hypothetical protein
MGAALQRHFARHALFYVIALGLGAQAFGTSFYDNFWPVEREDMAKLGWWQVAALVVKSLSFAVGIVVGYLIKSPSQDSNDYASRSMYPFAPRDIVDPLEDSKRRNAPPSQ